MSLEDANRPPVQYHVWFRHTGMEPPGEDWWNQATYLYNLAGIKKAVEGHTLTHLVMKGNILSDIHLFAPHLTHVAILAVSEEESNSSRFANMKHLKVLHSLVLSDNPFTSLPTCVYEMRNLATLDIRRNRSLTHLNPEILQLTKLITFKIVGCTALTTPPYEVYNQGLNAIRQYYTDLAEGAGRNLPFVTIAVIGNTMAGKTSLIRTLQSSDKMRVLTNREPHALVDEPIRVFNVEEVKVDDTVLRLIDMGGREIYHVTYQLTLKQHCIPVIVVSMEQYMQVSDESNEREAVRRLAFDWMSHWYLANPVLGPPKLILTHKDKFEDSEFAAAKLNFLKLSEEMCREIVEEEKQIGGEFCKIQHFSDSSTPLFLPEDIYEVGTDESYSVFDNIKLNLLQSSHAFVKPLPKIWEDVNEFIMSLQTSINSLVELVDILREIDGSIEETQLKIILRYMHACGKVLWYEDIEILQPYIFLNIAAVTNLLCVLYNNDENAWSMRLEPFMPFHDQDGTTVNKKYCEALVQKFLNTGVLDEILLHYLIALETPFASDTNRQAAVALLQSFRLLHGPLHLQSLKSSYIIPYFATGYHDVPQPDTEQEQLTLQVDVTFEGLALPRYVYHQMDVGVLDMFPSERASMFVKSNGVQVFYDDFDIQLTHNYKSRKASIQVSSKVENVCHSWDKLIKVTNSAVVHVLNSWPAARPVCFCLCAHCLLAENPNPERITNPDWFIHSLKIEQKRLDIQKGSQMVICSNKRILSPLKFPCSTLTETEIENLKKLVVQLKLDRKTSTQSSEDAQNASDEREAQQADYSADDLSDLSDDDEYLYPVDDVTRSMVSMRLRVKPTTSSKIRKLFSNTDKIFPMTPVKGRFLIINNKNFLNRPDECRHGSDADVKNMRDMLNAFNFEVIVHSDLQAKDMLFAIKREVEHKDHIDYGMFGLLIMSHGTKNSCIYGTDMKLVHLNSVYDFMTPLNFPSMKGKPKLVILETCSGDRIDVGEKGIHVVLEASEMVTEVVQPPSSQIGQPQHADKMTGLNYDDLFVIKSSFESFIAKIHPDYGSLMIRALVSTMSKHACHHDMHEIYKAVQSKVRKLCIDREFSSGQMVIAQDTLTHGRKLFLFPGYNGSTSRHEPGLADTSRPEKRSGQTMLSQSEIASEASYKSSPQLVLKPKSGPIFMPGAGQEAESKPNSKSASSPVSGDLNPVNERGVPGETVSTESYAVINSTTRCEDPAAFKPIPEGLIDSISSLCETYNIEFAAIAQSTEDWREILVLGENAVDIKNDLEHEMKKNKAFGEFFVILKNEKDPIIYETKASWIETLTVREKKKSRAAGSWTPPLKWTTCEILVKAEQTNKDNLPAARATYVVAPAHLIFTKEQAKSAAAADPKPMKESSVERPSGPVPPTTQLEAASCDTRELQYKIDEVRKEVESESTRRRYSIQVNTCNTFVDLKHPILFCYRHWYHKPSLSASPFGNCPMRKCPVPATEDCNHRFMNDIALLPTEYKDAEDMHLQLQGDLEHWSEINGIKPPAYSELFKIESLKHLKDLHEKSRQILVKGYKGTLLRETLNPIRPGQEMGRLLTFTIPPINAFPATNILQDGDCGIIVYMEENGVFVPAGMFVGVSKLNIDRRGFTGPHYQAIVLDAAFKDIECDYAHHVNSIRLFKKEH